MVIVIKRRKKDDIENSVNNSENKKLVSTKSGGDSPVSPVSPAKTGDSGESGETHSKFVGDSKKSRNVENMLLHKTVVEGNDGRKVTIEVYDTGAYKETVTGDKVIRERQLKFIIKYKNNVKECVSDCRDAVREIARATHYSPSAKEIMSVISELRERYATTEEISIVDYVRQKYPDRLAEIERDPFAWILERTKEIVGYERLKLLTFLAVVSSQMERVMGMSRLHLMLVGKSGAGKSSTVKSVLKFVDFTNIYIPGTRFTKNALGYLNIDTFDGKILFLEQIDRQIINYLREMMTEDRITTWVTEKVTDETGEHYETRQVIKYGQAVVITTSVADTIDVDRDQLFNRFLKVYVNPNTVDTDKVIESIWLRRKTELSEVDKLVFLAYLFSRPKYADTTDTLERAKKFLRPLNEYTREPLTRATEVLRNLAIAVAIARGKTKIDDEDFEFVMRNFQLDVLYNGLGLTEGDVEIIRLLPDEGGLKSSEIADALRMSNQYAINQLKNLERKGVVEGNKEDKKQFTWYLTPLGRKIKSLINNIDNITVTRNEKGEIVGAIDNKFQPDTDAGNDSGNAVSGNDRDSVSRGDKQNDRITEAYRFLKENGSVSVAELTELFGDDIIEKLKAKDLVTFNIIDGVEYVIPK